MNKQDLTKEVGGYITTKLFGGHPPADFTNDTPIISTRLLDSIVVLGMISDFEEKYKIEFEAHEVSVDNLDTINKTVDFLLQKLAK